MPDSATAEAFGASVDISSGQSTRGLYLVVGNESAATVVRSSGGQVVTSIGNGRLLSVLTMDESAALQRHHEIRLCGPVTIDRRRFDIFLAAAGLRAPP